MPVKQDNGERIGKLEASFDSFKETYHSDITEVRGALKAIQSTLGASGKINYGLLLSAIVVLLALYGAAIRPLETSSEQLRIFAKEQATAVLVQNITLQQLALSQTKTDERLISLQSAFDIIRREGTPIVDKRLSLIEFQLKLKDGVMKP